MRAVLRLTFSTCTALPFFMSAALMMNAADDGSPGTLISAECMLAGPLTRAVRSPAVVSTPYSGSVRKKAIMSAISPKRATRVRRIAARYGHFFLSSSVSSPAKGSAAAANFSSLMALKYSPLNQSSFA